MVMSHQCHTLRRVLTSEPAYTHGTGVSSGRADPGGRSCSLRLRKKEKKRDCLLRTTKYESRAAKYMKNMRGHLAEMERSLSRSISEAARPLRAQRWRRPSCATFPPVRTPSGADRSERSGNAF